MQTSPQFLATRSLEEARALLTRQYCSHTVIQLDRSASLDLRYSQAALPDMSFNYLQYGAEVEVRPREFESFYMVQIPLSGQSQIKTGSRSYVIGRGTAGIISPNHRMIARWKADCSQLMLKIDRSLLHSYLSNLIFQPIDKPLEFSSPLDVRAGLGASFYNLAVHLGEELATNRAMLHSELVVLQIQQTLMALLLSSADHTYRDALQTFDRSICPKHVHKAYSYMIANASEPITIADLARLTGVSGRALHEGFRRFKGASPKACLKSIRMRGVHRELLEARGSDDITSIAQRWGFSHLGRFANSYRRIFGELPSQTLRRNR